VRLLLSKNEAVADENATVLYQRNQLRKQYDQQIAQEATMILESTPHLDQQKSIVLFQAHWHKGIVGIAASRIVEAFHKPTIILTESNGIVVGSARSVAGFNIHNAIKKCEHLLINFGGHAHAAGLSLKKSKVNIFREKFEIAVKETIEAENLIPVIDVSASIELEKINYTFFKILKQMAPFGPHNRNPIFVAKKVRDTGFSRLLKGNHLRVQVKQGDSEVFNGIAFGMGNYLSDIQNQEFDIAFTLNENNWNGKKELQLNIKDIKA
ncbi:MAG: DHHA1 domain-containing protein, partial [Bacteroidota bacterium]